MANGGDGMQVQVRRRDSLWYYSQLFALPLRLILDSNPGLDPDRLAAGNSVAIPGWAAADYLLQPGDSFWRLSRQRGIPIDALYLLNQTVNAARLRVGQRIRVPTRITWPLVAGQREYGSRALAEDLRRLTRIYPFLRQRTIGQSVRGQSLVELRLGRGPKRVHMNGSFHANEWITTPTLMTFLNDYLLALTTGRPIRGRAMLPLYEATTLSLVPMVNPDGVDLVLTGPPPEEPWRSRVVEINGGSRNFSGWKANIRGVDLNDQFPALWEREAARGRSRPAPRDYTGEAPLTEPEAQAMAELTRRGDFARVLAFHTQGEVIYWGFQGLEPPEALTLVTEFARVSGYEPVRTIDSYAGYKDWFIQDWRRPGFTVELGLGINPLPLSQFPEIYQEALGIFLASLYM